MTERNPEPKPQRRAERLVHFSLLAGLAVAAVLLLLGLLAGLIVGQPDRAAGPPSLSRLLRAASSGDARALMDLGLLTLMMTPLLRVAVLIVGWMLAGERQFVLVAAAVLALLSLSMLLGVG